MNTTRTDTTKKRKIQQIPETNKKKKKKKNCEDDLIFSRIYFECYHLSESNPVFKDYLKCLRILIQRDIYECFPIHVSLEDINMEQLVTNIKPYLLHVYIILKKRKIIIDQYYKKQLEADTFDVDALLKYDEIEDRIDYYIKFIKSHFNISIVI